jgi:hypothetical protein
MKSLKVILSKKVRIPKTLPLSTADDVSAAFHIAVNGSEIDWPFAEGVRRVCFHQEWACHQLQKLLSRKHLA